MPYKIEFHSTKILQQKQVNETLYRIPCIEFYRTPFNVVPFFLLGKINNRIFCFCFCLELETYFQLVFTCSKLAMENPKQCPKFVQNDVNDVVLVFLLFT